MIRRILVFTGVIVATILFLFGHQLIKSVPIPIRKETPSVQTSTKSHDVPERNKQIILFVETNGATIAPTYQPVVCTEFVIKVIEEFKPLSKQEKKAVRIITDKSIGDLIEQDSDIIKGVCTALTMEGKGVVIADAKEVLPGDFVQFWNTSYTFFPNGHCGIVKDIEPMESITMYSSHPITNGYGIHKFPWPDKVYFARMK